MKMRNVALQLAEIKCFFLLNISFQVMFILFQIMYFKFIYLFNFLLTVITLSAVSLCFFLFVLCIQYGQSWKFIGQNCVETC